MIKYCIPVFAVLIQHSLVAMEYREQKAENKRCKPLSIKVLKNRETNIPTQSPKLKDSTDGINLLDLRRKRDEHVDTQTLYRKRTLKELAASCRTRCSELQYENLQQKLGSAEQRHLAHAEKVTRFC